MDDRSNPTHKVTLTAHDYLKDIPLVEEVCDLCEGTKEMGVYSLVYPNDPGSPVADLGDTVPCPRCKRDDSDDWDQDR